MPANVIGLDIGGANLKAARSGGEARSRAFQLWKSPNRLGAALRELLDGWEADRLAFTMTGELCDCFENKRDGVSQILAEVESAFPQKAIDVWSSEGKFVGIDSARSRPLNVAAANWHALATWVGRTFLADRRSALLIDIGSTTTDIIPIRRGAPVPFGLTDPERLQSSELVYTGVKRTPVCALAREGVAAEFFASTHDVYLRLGMVPDEPECRDTADGRPATAAHAHSRLARMLGGDQEITPATKTEQLALAVHARQRTILINAIRTVASRIPESPVAVVLSGSGEFLARLAWLDGDAGLGESKPQLLSLAEFLGPAISAAACAYAVALLAESE